MSASAASSSGPLRHIPALDGLRGLAIAMVLVHHLFVFTPVDAASRWTESFVEFASHGVDLFFALSGFLITSQLALGRERPGFARRFWLRRCAKIVPVYVFMIAVVFAALPPAAHAFHLDLRLPWIAQSSGHWPWYGLFCSNLRNALDGRFTIPPLDICWSLAVEVQFYVAAFLVARLCAPTRWPPIAIAAILGAVLFRTICVLAGANWIQILVLTPGRLDAFAFGALAALVGHSFRRVPAAAVALVVAWPFLFPWSRALPAIEIGGYSLVAFACGLAVAHAAQAGPASRLGRVLGAAVPSWLGKISYSLYLTHLPVRAVLRDWWLPPVRELDGVTGWGQQALFLLLGGGVCIAVGWAVWRFVEEPCRQLLVRRASLATAPAPVVVGYVTALPAEKFGRED